MKYQITRKNVNRGLRIFILLSVLGLLTVFLLTHSDNTGEALKSFNYVYLLAALALILVEWMLGGFRIYVFGRVLYPGLRFKACVKASLGNVFFGAVTPAQTGGGAAQIYLLYAGGMPVVEATSASLMSFLSTVSFLIVAAVVIFIFKGRAPLSRGILSQLFNAGVFLFISIGVLVILALAFPGIFRKITIAFFRLLSCFRKKDYFCPGSRANRVADGADRCHRQLTFYIRKKLLTCISGVVITCAAFLAKFSIAYIVLLGLGVRASYFDVVILNVLIILINYFFPSPGASGSTELSAAALMAAIVPTSLLPFYVIIWRFFTLYISVVAGGMVVLHELGKKEKIEIENGTEDGQAGTVRGECP